MVIVLVWVSSSAARNGTTITRVAVMINRCGVQRGIMMEADPMMMMMMMRGSYGRKRATAAGAGTAAGVAAASATAAAGNAPTGGLTAGGVVKRLLLQVVRHLGV